MAYKYVVELREDNYRSITFDFDNFADASLFMGIAVNNHSEREDKDFNATVEKIEIEEVKEDALEF